MSTQVLTKPLPVIEPQPQTIDKIQLAILSLEKSALAWMAQHGLGLLRLSIGIIFIWFGALKLAGVSPAADLVARTLFWLPPAFLNPFLGLWEIAIGLGFFYTPWLRVSLLLLLLHMPGTALPFLVLPQECFVSSPALLTMEGQYIVKNIVLVSGAMVVASMSRPNR